MLQIIITVALIGFAIWAILQIPQLQAFKNIIMGLGILMIVVYVLNALGLINYSLPK